jgi:hypothetical protein
LIAESGTTRCLQTWPRQVLGQIETSDGRTIAWSNDAQAPALLWIDETGGIGSTGTPFRPNRVIESAPGEFLCVAYEGGLWAWRPGAAPERLASTPPAIALHQENGGIALSPIARDDAGATLRHSSLPDRVWRDGRLIRRPVGADGPCWSRAASAGGWIAEALPHADAIRLSKADAEFVLGCYYPVSVAWAGRTLIAASSTAGRLIAFARLEDLLNDQAARAFSAA